MHQAYHGLARRRALSAGFQLLETGYQPNSLLPKHSHAEAHLCLVLEGLYHEELDARIEQRLPDTLILYGPEVPHGERHFSAGRHFLINMDSRWLSDNAIALSSRVWTSTSPLAVKGARSLHQMMEGKQTLEMDAELLIRQLLNIITEDTPQSDRRPQWLSPVIQRISQIPSSQSLSDLAGSAGLHPSHLAREFHRFMGCSVGELRRRRQVEEACRQIAFTIDSLSMIALSAGYCDQSHLCREVRRRTGLTPAKLRRAVQKN